MKLYYLLYCIIIVVIHVNLIKAHYTQQWAVHIEGGSKIADEVATDHGFINHGLVSLMYTLYENNLIKIYNVYL